MRAIKALSRMFPADSFQLHYCELGMFFAGRAMFHDGECHEESFDEKTSVMRIACDIFGYEDEDEEPCEIDTVA